VRVNPKWTILFLIWLTLMVAYIDRIDIAVAGPTLMSALHLTKSQFGLVLSAFTLGYALMQFPGGHLADRIGSRPLLVVGILVWSVFTFLTGLASSLLTLIAIRIVFGIGEGAENGAQFKLIGDYFTPTERSRASSIFLTALALGPALGTPLAAWLIRSYGWREMFFMLLAPGLLVAALLFFGLPKGNLKVAAEPDSRAPDLRKALAQPASWLCAIGYLLFNVAFWGFLSWIPTYLTAQRQITLSKMGVTGAIPYLCGFAGMLLAGHLGATVARNRRAGLVAVCFLLSAVFLYLAVQAEAAGACVAWLSVAAFFLYGAFGPFWGLALGLTSPEARGGFAGFVNLCGQIGGFSAQIIMGFLADRMGSFNGAILFMVGSVACGGVAMLALERINPGPDLAHG
jgi:sugar phosphate permease